MPTPQNRSTEMSASVIARTGVASTRIRLVAYSDQTKSGSRNHVSPGARILWMVTMKFMPVMMLEKPTMKTPAAIEITCEFA